MTKLRHRFDRPRSVFAVILIVLCGFPILLVAFVADSLDVPYAHQVFVALFSILWLTGVLSWLWHISGLLEGK
jgi:hypothetical protein